MDPKPTPKTPSSIPVNDSNDPSTPPDTTPETLLGTPDSTVNGIDLSDSLGAPEDKSKRTNPPKKPKKGLKYIIKDHKVVFIVILLLIIASVTALVLFLLNRPQPQSNNQESAPEPPHYYSRLSGEEITSDELNTLPTFCVQIPNGMDGPRPQTGLTKAPIVFEAIAEAGITRFAAIFQGIDDSAIGPIRSLRPYYLQWDTPFDCTVVHAGGSDEALADLKSGHHRDLTENNTYMWRDNGAGYARPNNLFTSATLLNNFNTDNNYSSSDPKAFPRLKPDEAAQIAKENQTAAEPLTDEEKQAATDSEEKPREVVPLITNIAIRFGSNNNFNLNYTYNSDTNSYARAYASGVPHTTHTCPANLNNPHPRKDCGEATQLTPKVVVAMVVQESRAADGYHENITTTGTGQAYIFQNGQAIEATWSKANAGSQIEFKDADGNQISFTPGQMWISAIPSGTGSVKY